MQTKSGALNFGGQQSIKESW